MLRPSKKQQSSDGLEYLGGVYHRKPRARPECNRKVAGIFLGCTIVFIIILVLAIIFNNPFFTRGDEKIKTNITNPLPCLEETSENITAILEENMISLDRKYYFFDHRLSFAASQEVCKGLPGGGTHFSLSSKIEEDNLDNKITSILTDEDLRLWTGGYFNLADPIPGRIQFMSGQGLTTSYNKFCEPLKAMEKLNALVVMWKKKEILQPIVHIVKDYRKILDGYKRMGYDHGKGCWQLYDPFLYDLDHIKLNFVCQTLKSNEPYKFSHRITGKFRADKTQGEKANDVPAYAKQYAAFRGSGSYWLAQETCRKMGSGSTLIMPKTLNLDEDINKNVERQYQKIFGENNFETRWRPLIWTGGYFNLSSSNPLRVRWIADPQATMDIKKIRIQYWGASTDKPFQYENFCGPKEHYEKMVNDAIKQERDASHTTGCIKGRIFVIVKDFRDAQVKQGCWHVYDLDFLSKHQYKLHLICTLPGEEVRNISSAGSDFNHDYKLSKKIFTYNPKRYPDVDWKIDDLDKEFDDQT